MFFIKKNTISKKYQAGIRDFKHVNVRGQSLENLSLIEADFSSADIRGTNFTDTDLSRAKFTNAKAGSSNLWIIFCVLGSIITSIIIGAFLGVSCFWVFLFHDGGNTPVHLFGAINIIILIALLIIQSFSGLISTAISFIIFFSILFIYFEGTVFPAAGIVAISITVSMLLSLITNIIMTVLKSELISTFLAALIYIIAIFSSSINSKSIEFFVAYYASTNARLLNLEPGESQALNPSLLENDFASLAISIARIGVLALFIFSIYLLYRINSGDKKYLFLRNLSTAIASKGGTSFRGANLEYVDFSGVNLKNVDLRKIKISFTCWNHTKKLDQAYLGNNVLRNSKIRNILVTGNTESLNLNGENLECLMLKDVNLANTSLSGANFSKSDLREANLANADLTGVDFSKSDLRGANLSRAILVQSQLANADLTGACLTGACIQNWSITRDTILKNINCEYVYLKLNENKDKCDQMPPRKTFGRDGFELFIKYIIDTVDIYHERDINPRLALSILKKISQDYDQPLEVVAIGKQGENIFIKIKLSRDIHPYEFKKKYHLAYNSKIKKISDESIKIESIDEAIENKISELSSEDFDNQTTINYSHIEYIHAASNLIIEGDIEVGSVGDIYHGPVGVGKVFGGNVQGVGEQILNNSDQYCHLQDNIDQILQLLVGIDERYPQSSIEDKIRCVNEDIQPITKKKIISAINSGGESILDKFVINNNYIHVIKAVIKGWLKE